MGNTDFLLVFFGAAIEGFRILATCDALPWHHSLNVAAPAVTVPDKCCQASCQCKNREGAMHARVYTCPRRIRDGTMATAVLEFSNS